MWCVVVVVHLLVVVEVVFVVVECRFVGSIGIFCFCLFNLAALVVFVENFSVIVAVFDVFVVFVTFIGTPILNMEGL